MAGESNVYIPNGGALSDLEGWIAGQLGAATVHLYDVFRNPTPADVPASFHESSFVGYAPLGPVAWGAPFINGGGKAESDSPVLTWTFTAGVGTALVYGWYIVNAGLTRVLASSPFLSPVILAPASNVLSRVIQLTEVSEL
jgi:hypothetical protein